MNVNIFFGNSYSAQEAARAKSVLDKTGQLLSSDAFREEVMAFRTPIHGQTFFYRVGQNRYSNAEVYQRIINAVEYPGNVTNGVIDLYLHLEDGGDGSVVGYGRPGEREIHTYRDMYVQMEGREYAAHIIHEWLHKLGFEHDYADLPMRRYSVPYGVQSIIMRLYQ